MKFKIYDILTMLIPGFTMYIVTLYFLDIQYSKDFIVPATAIAFIIGFFMNTISSWLETFYFLTWGGKPSSRLIEGNDIAKVRFYEFEKAHKLLTLDSNNSDATNDELFSIAYRIAVKEKNERVEDFNASYAFSRMILTTVLIAGVLICIKYYSVLWIYAVTGALILIAWIRCKQRAYYFAREVLNAYLNTKENQSASSEIVK